MDFYIRFLVTIIMGSAIREIVMFTLFITTGKFLAHFAELDRSMKVDMVPHKNLIFFSYPLGC